MRRWEVAAVALVLLWASVPALALPTPPAGPFVPHAPIVIDEDADFTPANGVASGSGTPADPYVISGWSITTSATAIVVTNVTANFTIRDNSFDAGLGVHVFATAVVGLVQNNQFTVRGTGLAVANADVHARDNSFVGTTGSNGGARGVDLLNSNSRIESNAFLYVQIGIRAERGSPSILCNDLHDDVIVAGVSLKYTINARVDCNVFTRCHAAVSAASTIGTIIVNNTVVNCRFGIIAVLTKDLHAENNSIQMSIETQVILDTTSGVFTNNTIINGKADAVIVLRSPVFFANNTITANLGVGVRFQETTAEVRANVIVHNNVGIKLESGSVPLLVANVMINNTIGVDIPYASRQVIVSMSANIVNGVNIDGTINASQRVYFYQAANVTIAAQVRDSGFSAGFFGSLTAQGGVVLYDSNTANINATVISNHQVGVYVVNSFNVNVNGSFLLSNQIAIKTEVIVGGGTVPPCVISIKDTNITIPVDPIATVGIDVKGCLAIVGRVNVSIVDTGIRVDGQSSLILFNSTIFDTKLALDIQGRPGEVNLTGNLVYNNRAGARLSGTSGPISANTFLDNDAYGMRLENGAALTLVGNNFTANGVGLTDSEVCLGLLSCSTVTARGNSFYANVGDGAQVNGASTWKGDVAIANGGDGFDLSSTATLDDVVAIANGGDGARILGTFDVEDSLFTLNEDDGLEVRGAGELRDSDFTSNEEAGIRVAATSLAARGLNVSSNFDGIITAEGATLGAPTSTSVPGLLAVVTGTSGNGGLLMIHRSTFLANERDAIRGGGVLVNATHNYWGKTSGPSVSIADTLGAFQNGVSPLVRFAPFYTDPSMTTTGPVPGL